MQRMKDIMIDCYMASASNLDLRKNPGYKLEIVGFDFLLDEDLRVWLLEVNTCPYMGPVLTEQQPKFMLDMLNDTFKLTLDPLFFGCSLSSAEIETETEYELLCSGDQSITRRSKYGLETNDQEPIYMAEFPPGFYPS